MEFKEGNFNKSVKEYYIFGERYDWVVDPRRFERVYHGLRFRVFLKVFRSVCRCGGVVLDAGCGTGLITRFLPRGSVAVDINPWNLERVRDRISWAHVIQADVEHLPFRDGCFDMVVCTEVLEHIPRPESAVGEFYRVLKNPEGVLIGSVPSINPVWRLRKLLLSTCPASEPFHRNYTSSRLKYILKVFASVKIKLMLLGMNLLFICRK